MFHCFPDDGIHLRHFADHILGQGDLAAGAHQIVAGIIVLEVQISVNVICQETNSQFRSQRKGTVGQGFDFRFRQGLGGFMEAYADVLERLQK